LLAPVFYAYVEEITDAKYRNNTEIDLSEMKQPGSATSDTGLVTLRVSPQELSLSSRIQLSPLSVALERFIIQFTMVLLVFERDGGFWVDIVAMARLDLINMIDLRLDIVFALDVCHVCGKLC
jgi:hypothetical protein